MNMPQTKAIGLLSILFMLMAVVSLVAIEKLEHATSSALATRTAKALISVVNQARISYSSHVVSKLNTHPEIEVEAQYHHKALAIPNPATFAIELGQAVSKPDEGLIISTYSKFPFKWREKTGGPQDKFQQDALNSLSEIEPSFERIEVINGVGVLRHAEAIFMEASCIECHNTHPFSPRKNWKMGDVRGAIEVSVPLNGSTNDTAHTVRYAYIMFMALSAIGLLCMFITLKRAQGLSRELELSVELRTSKLNKIARTDSLTQIANRRYFEEFSEQIVNQQNNDAFPMAMVIYDLDYFKAINDYFGHDVGDVCLIKVVQSVAKVLRKGDFHARIGGEEFAIILKNISDEELALVMNRVLKSVESIAVEQYSDISMSCSIGSTVAKSFEGVSIKRMVKVADEALYLAKQQGRNRWVNKSFYTDPSKGC